MKTIWKFEMKGARGVRQRAPVVIGEKVIVTLNHGLGANFQGTIAALDAETGAELWRYDRSHIFAPTIAAPDGSIYATCFDGSVQRLDPEGMLVWSTQVTGRNIWSGVLHEGHFLVSEIAGGSRKTFALDAQSGAVAWEFEDGGHCYGIAADDAGSVFISSAAGSFDDVSYGLHCVEARSGKPPWKATYPDILWRPAVYRDWIVVGSRGSIAAFDRAGGAPVTRLAFPDKAEFWETPIALDDRAILASKQGLVVALDIGQKTRLLGKDRIELQIVWQRQVGSEIEYLGMGDESVLVLSKSGHLHRIDPATGEAQPAEKLPGYKEGSGVVQIDDNSFVTANGRIYARVAV